MEGQTKIIQMKRFFAIIIFFALVASCAKEKEDLVDTSANEIEDLNSLEAFENKISTGVSVIFFHASWCSVCAEQRPAVEATSMMSAFNNVFFGEVEFEANNEINEPYGVIGFPTIVFFKDGVEQERFTGKGHSEAAIAAEINALL